MGLKRVFFLLPFCCCCCCCCCCCVLFFLLLDSLWHIFFSLSDSTNSFESTLSLSLWTSIPIASVKFSRLHVMSTNLNLTIWCWNSFTIDAYIWRCPWCNGYRRRKWTRWHEIKSWTRLIAFHIALIPLRKVWIQLWVNSRYESNNV